VGGPDGVIVRVFRKVRAQFWPRHAATAAQRVYAGLVNISKHVVVHQVSALPGWSGAGKVHGDVANAEGGDGGRGR